MSFITGCLKHLAQVPLNFQLESRFGRRKLTLFRRAGLALKLKPLIAEKAKKKQRESGGAVVKKSGEPPLRTDKELGKLAGVSHDTIAKVEVIQEEATEAVTEARRMREADTLEAIERERAKERMSKDVLAAVIREAYQASSVK